MQHDGLRSILDKVEAGQVPEAREALRPYVVGESEAPPAEVCYVLGRTFFGEDNGTARYLFELALSADPAFREAGEYEARCGSALGDLESFTDERHPACEVCHLHYRDVEPQCPYCGSWPESGDAREKESSFESQFRIAREEMMETIRDFTERDEVKRAREKAEAAGKVALGKAREFSQSEKAQELKATARAIGIVAARRARALGQRPEVQTAKDRASQLGQEAKEKAKAFSEREDVKETLEKASTTSRNFMSSAQDYVKADQARFNDGDATERAKVVGKWFVIGLVILFILKWIFGGD